MPRRAALVCVVCSLLGCMSELDEIWLVKDLRMLGIRATPPQLPLTATPMPPATVDALVVNPTAPPSRPYDWELWVCTADSPLCDGARVQTLLRRDRTTLDNIRHELVLSEEIRRRSMELFSQSSAGWWVPVTLELRVFQDSEPDVRGVKRLRLHDLEPIRNPQLVRIEVDGGPLTDPVRIERCRTVQVSVWIDSSQGTPAIDVYVSRGRFTSRELMDTDDATPDLTVGWSPCAAGTTPASGSAHLWLVARDGLGGIDWAHVRATIDGATP